MDVIKCEFGFECEGKRKSAITFVTALFFLVAGTRLSFISFRMGLWGRLNKENRFASQLFFYAFNLHSSLRLVSVYGIKKPEPNDSGFLCREEYRIIEPYLGGVGGVGIYSLTTLKG